VSRLRSLGHSLALLLLVVPLIPIQPFFAAPVSVIGGISLALALLARPSQSAAEVRAPA
jgi:hypothetical protein